MTIFAVKPKKEMTRIGDDLTGVVELPVYHGLTVEEDATYQELIKDLPNIQQETAKAAEVISAAEEGISPGEAYDLVIRGMISGISGMTEDKERTAFTRHVKLIQEVSKSYDTFQRMERRAMATMLIRCRKGLADWEIPGVFNQALLNALADFARDEARNEIRARVPMTDELVGKQPAESSAVA